MLPFIYMFIFEKKWTPEKERRDNIPTPVLDALIAYAEWQLLRVDAVALKPGAIYEAHARMETARSKLTAPEMKVFRAFCTSAEASIPRKLLALN